MSLDPAVAAARLAVRRSLAGTLPGVRTVLVACSGGADSLALLAATVFEGRGGRWGTVGVTVDHGLQEGSDEHAQRVVAQMVALGADETATIRVTVEPAGRGVEGAAREARYAALAELAERVEADRVLLGHTRDDQAETVLLGLTRGSGGRSIAGMRRGFDRFVRPFLDLSRAQTEAACSAEQITWWDDPHNADPRFTRARIRHRVLPVLEEELGPGVAEALARTADGLRDDVEALDAIADQHLRDYDPAVGFDLDHLETLPRGLRTRLLRLAALRAGSPPSDLTRQHVLGLEELVRSRDGRTRALDLPGPVHAVGDRERVVLRPGRVGGPPPP